jgi:hypothetical protein
VRRFTPPKILISAIHKLQVNFLFVFLILAEYLSVLTGILKTEIYINYDIKLIEV